MGQCMSRKAAGAFAASAAATHNRPGEKMHKQQQGQLQSPGDESSAETLAGKRPSHTKGVSTSFGFRRRPSTAPSITANPNAARRLASGVALIAGDKNGNGDADVVSTEHAAPIGQRSAATVRLVPPKKEGCTTRVNRFGFRQPQINRLNRIADLNTAVNNNPPKARAVTAYHNNRNRNEGQIGRYMLQTTQLPRPEPIRLIETKSAKTLANNSKKTATAYRPDDHSSKDGSSTEDSGVGVTMRTADRYYDGDNKSAPGIERLNCSPTYGVRRSASRSRNLEVLRSTGNKFDVRDLEEENVGPIPRLPSAFNNPNNNHNNHNNNNNKSHVREMALEYQRQHLLTSDDNRRKISVTSSEGFSDDYAEDEKNFRDLVGNEKSFRSTPFKSFLKPRSDSSSTENEWFQAGEAMADDVSFSISSSDESRDKDTTLVFRTLPTRPELKRASLTLEDPKFAAVAATVLLLDDETSPVDSLLSCTESEDLFRKKPSRSSSNSKDVNEKLTPPSPGTPTNASNSLSLSDAKDDFLIDDEIADQPALVFEDARARDFSLSETNSLTIVDTTPKFRRRVLGGVEGSPLLRNRKLLASRTGSLDTLSPCESIASDDLMMDYDYSQSSGVEDVDRNNTQNRGFASLEETGKFDLCPNREGLRDWASLLGNCVLDGGALNGVGRNSKLLWSRTATPNSAADSLKSLDGKGTASRCRASVTGSPLRLRPGHPATGYDSDDSVRLDRTNHAAMKQDIGSMKTMLVKLKRVLNESETHIPFNGQPSLTNGLFTGPNSAETRRQDEEDESGALELAELRRQVLFLQGQLEDKERTVRTLHDQMVRMEDVNCSSNSAPTSVQAESTCNAATQTERVRPLSAGPSLLNGSASENAGSLVSANESPPSVRSRPPSSSSSDASRRSSPSIWRKPGEPPSPRYSSIPRRANSRSRTPSTPSS